jgi:hypothetical protein
VTQGSKEHVRLLTVGREDAELQSLLADAMAGVIEATNNPRPVSVDAEVARLLEAHPGSPVSPGELKQYLMILAVDVLAAIEVGASSDEAAPHAELLMREFHRLSQTIRARREAA